MYNFLAIAITPDNQSTTNINTLTFKSVDVENSPYGKAIGTHATGNKYLNIVYFVTYLYFFTPTYLFNS
ncbi:hypothetical protein [Lyngbya sp. PCC 8106]|uniref:hypothetical protein n=1 Tax=Lyngbya sp. (strain PCC 8106) TaxID=313612 RepID=UPI0012E9BAC1|nr:hypothetical protein [Lyngbya sp. PCC 8106]